MAENPQARSGRGIALGPRRFAALVFGLVALALLASAPGATARTTRAYEGSIASGMSTRTIAVDQSNGDVYVVSRNSSTPVHRFTEAGAPKNFTAGPDSGTNTLTGLQGTNLSIAFDNSSGPLAGHLYVSYGDPSDFIFGAVRVFASTGAPLGTLIGSTIPKVGGFPGGKFGRICGVAVDPSDGNLYVKSGELIWRYAPNSPSGAIDDSDYTLIGGIDSKVPNRNEEPCSLAADAGNVYVVGSAIGDFALHRFSAADFTPTVPAPDGTVIDQIGGAVAVDHATGEIYLDQGNKVAVFDESGASLYEFGAAAYFGIKSRGIAVRSAVSGPATKVYVADDTEEGRVEIFGDLTKVKTFSHDRLASFGPDGTSASSFPLTEDHNVLAFDGAARRLYALSQGAPGIYGFDATSPPAFPPLGAFDPLGTADTGNFPGLAVDNTALTSAGNVYFASRETDLLYGFDDTGAPLPGFPIDPAVSPGSPDGSPKDLCGTAVDSSGNVWVSNFESKRILKYSSAGVYLSSLDVSAQGRPCQLALDSDDDLYVTQDKGVYRYTAASGYTAVTGLTGREQRFSERNAKIAVDPATDHLYVAGYGACEGGEKCVADLTFNRWVDEFDEAGNLVDEYGIDELTTDGGFTQGITVDPISGNTYVSVSKQIHAIGPGYLLPEPRIKPPSALTNETATLNGTVNTQELPLNDCYFEYVSEAAFFVTGFTDLSSGGTAPCDPDAGSIPVDLDDHPVSGEASGLSPNTKYRFRLLAANADGTAEAQGSLTTTGPPEVQTTGTTIRSTTKALLTGRVYPVRASTTYHFEYGTEGPCDSNPCTSTPAMPAGSGDEIELVAEEVSDLSPDTTYHYRLVADNGNSAGPGFGEDMTVTTRSSEQLPGQDDRFPGPPGSDRAWELASIADSSGNPISQAMGFSDSGTRAAYGISGGTPISNSGSFFSLYFSERPAGEHPSSGWQARLITPAREHLIYPNWAGLYGSSDLSRIVSSNSPFFLTDGPYWRLDPGAPPQLLFAPSGSQEIVASGTTSFAASGDGSRVTALLKGGILDPAYPAAASVPNLYDISSGGDPQLLSIMPSGQPPLCGADFFLQGPSQPQVLSFISEDGSLVYFPSKGDDCSDASQLYLRDIGATTTALVSGPPLSGPSCEARLVKAVPGAAFFLTATQLDPDDPTSGCELANEDVYRYEESSGSLECLTCLVPGVAIGVQSGVTNFVAVAEDGSRVYFSSVTSLLPGVPTGSTYRLDVASGDLAFVPGLRVREGGAQLSADGALVGFTSASPSMNPLGDAYTNGGKGQYYLYDDRDGSLLCVSCPLDGSLPVATVTSFENAANTLGQPNLGYLADDGTLAFATATSLIGADQNTPGPGQDLRAGTDVYEWRDGRQILVTDGLTSWVADTAPTVQGVTPSSKDIFFAATAQYTQDAIDANKRLYDARIGGGIEFPPAPKPCPLEVCQGTPKGAPQEQSPSSADFRGPGNPAATPSPAPRCRKGQRRVRRAGKVRCVKRKAPPNRKAKRNPRRAAQ